MKIGIVSTGIFKKEKVGGFEKIALDTALALKEKNIDVCIICPSDYGFGAYMMFHPKIGEIPIYTFRRARRFSDLISAYKGLKRLKQILDLDIIHHQAVSTYLPFILNVFDEAKHIVTFQDPRDFKDMIIERTFAEQIQPMLFSPFFPMYIIIKNKTLGFYLKKVDIYTAQAKFLVNKAMRLFNLSKKPIYIPNFVQVPKRKIKKSETPKVCFLGRLDKRKRPEIFIGLAKYFPDVEFIMIGRAHDIRRDRKIKLLAKKRPNIKVMGFVSEEKKNKILEECWILINTAAREALPVSFLEALAHKTAILSCNNPDNLTSNYGYYVQMSLSERLVLYDVKIVKKFANALKLMLEEDIWKVKGEKGYDFCKKHYDKELVIKKYIRLYKYLLYESC